MTLTRRQHKLLYGNNTIKRLGKVDKSFRWPGGIVPVLISPQFDQNYQRTIRAAADYISRGSCIKFDFSARSHPVYVNLLPGEPGVCSAGVGYSGATAAMKLDPSQCTQGSAIHEFLHVLGFEHMHTAPDRDNYVTVNYDNIEADDKPNFDKVSNDFSMFNTKYDLQVRFSS